jgi:hypothetical protein
MPSRFRLRFQTSPVGKPYELYAVFDPGSPQFSRHFRMVGLSVVKAVGGSDQSVYEPLNTALSDYGTVVRECATPIVRLGLS